jgi:Zn ribbon nucleic-acid-binding protein
MLFVRANSAAHVVRCTVRDLAAMWREQEIPVRRRPSGSGKVNEGKRTKESE